MSAPEFDRLIQACLRWLASARDASHANYDAELEYSEELILAAARALVAANSDGQEAP